MKRGSMKFWRGDSGVAGPSQGRCCDQVRRVSRRGFATALALLCLFAGCGRQSVAPEPAAQTEAAPAAVNAPDEVQAAAEALLGTSAEVLAFGDLAKTGKQQLLAVNRMPRPSSVTIPGTFFTRAIMAENSNGKWAEILRCDEHLKNAHGYLGRSPSAPLLGWRLEYEQSAESGLQLRFTPIESAADSHAAPISLRWNPAAKRYQELDRDGKHFLPEHAPVENASSSLR